MSAVRHEVQKGPGTINWLSTRPVDVESLYQAEQTAIAHEHLIRMFSADDECEHGNVPGTQPPRCDCFTRKG